MFSKFIQVIAIIACLFQAQLVFGQPVSSPVRQPVSVLPPVTAAPIRPSDIVPDKQPNDIPYGTPLSLSDAAKLKWHNKQQN